ncbi:MAG: type II secretion system secretin GspD [Myxococcales bacterium]|nr:type II secretion system secretin GspD [Myxococcales bacterium]
MNLKLQTSLLFVLPAVLAAGSARAQAPNTTIKERAAGGAAALKAGGAVKTPPATTTPAAGNTGGTASPAGTAAPGGTATPGAPPAVGPDGKAHADTQGLTQFENSVEFEPRGPNYRVAFSLEEADLGELVRVISQLTGKRFIFGGKVKSVKASVYSPQKVTVAEAYQAFLSILETNGLTVVPHGRFLKIVETANQVATMGTPVYGTAQGAPGEARFVTRMHRLGHISADDAANVLGKFKSKEADITVYGPGNMIIITDTGSNIRRMMQILEEIDVGSSGDQIFIEPIHYAAAADVEKRINDLFDVKGGSSPSPPPGVKTAPNSAASSGVSGGGDGVTKIVSDERSNSLVIVATERAYMRVLELIKRIDVPQTGEGEIHVLPLQHADATDLAKTLNEIITGSAAPAAGAAAGRGRAPAAAPAGGAAPTGVFDGAVKVSADKATNSIVVTSSLRDYASLRSVIDRLDQPRRQVFIEAVVMDLQMKRSNALGVSFHGGAPFKLDNPDDSVVFGGNKITNTIPPVPTDPDALQGFALGVRGPGISGSQNFLGTGISIPAFGTFIQALAKTGDSDLLSTPHILALDNEDAEINVGDNIPLQTNAVSAFPGALGGAAGAAGAAGALGGLGGLGGFGSFGSPRQDVGTKIKIKPHLNDSNEVRLDVTEEISEQGAPLGGTLGAIPISKRTANTKLVVQDQQTVVIGGLIRNVTSRAEEKVPVLGDIPVLGALFRKRTDTVEKRNLVLVLTPYIIRNQNDLRTVFERKMQERQQYLDRYFVFSDTSEFTAAKDWSRTNGLVEDIRQAYFQVEEKKRLEEITQPKQLKTHDPQQPLEMPQPASRSSSGASGPAPTTPVVTPKPTLVRPAGGGVPVRPPTRNVEKIER